MTPEETVLIRWIERTMRGEVGAFDALASIVKMCQECGVKSLLIDTVNCYVMQVQRTQQRLPFESSKWLTTQLIIINELRNGMLMALNAAKEAAK